MDEFDRALEDFTAAIGKIDNGTLPEERKLTTPHDGAAVKGDAERHEAAAAESSEAYARELIATAMAIAKMAAAGA